MYEAIKDQDPEVYKSMIAEVKRQSEGIELIPSENYVSQAVLEANGSILTNKYSEGYPGKRVRPESDSIVADFHALPFPVELHFQGAGTGGGRT